VTKDKQDPSSEKPPVSKDAEKPKVLIKKRVRRWPALVVVVLAVAVVLYGYQLTLSLTEIKKGAPSAPDLTVELASLEDRIEFLEEQISDLSQELTVTAQTAADYEALNARLKMLEEAPLDTSLPVDEAQINTQINTLVDQIVDEKFATFEVPSVAQTAPEISAEKALLKSYLALKTSYENGADLSEDLSALKEAAAGAPKVLALAAEIEAAVAPEAQNSPTEMSQDQGHDQGQNQGQNQSLWDETVTSLKSLVTVRKVGPTTGEENLDALMEALNIAVMEAVVSGLPTVPPETSSDTTDQEGVS